jgi:adenosylhomocysteine nucleosidase
LADGQVTAKTEGQRLVAAVVVSANAEWRVVRAAFPDAEARESPLGEWFVVTLPGLPTPAPVLFFHGGWGKIAAAASTQYLIDRWQPALLVNLGTCGGFAGAIERDTVILAERTLVYDILEQMGDPEEAIAHYATDLDLAWLGTDHPHEVRRTLLVSGDRDLVVDEAPLLATRFGAVAGDWESGAIAYVAARNRTRCLILRGVTDLVGCDGGEAYDGNLRVFVDGSERVMRRLIDQLPDWIARASSGTDTR